LETRKYLLLRPVHLIVRRVAPFLVAATLLVASAPAAGSCPSTADAAGFASTARLLRDNRVMAGFGQRPSGSPNQGRFIAWLQERLARIPGMRLDSLPYAINRWDFDGAALSAGGAQVALAGPVPYARPTAAGGATGKLVYVPVGTALTDGSLKDKIVVRDATPGSVPFAAFKAVEWFEWDPDGTLAQDAASSYERDFIGYNQRVTDLQDAAKAGAAALVFVHDFPRRQVRDQYAPYEGTRWGVPAVYVGADEGQRLKHLAAEGASATLKLAASDTRAATPTVIATLPGTGDERFVIESHTDGMNAIWDNGPIAILALARYFAQQPLECRPRTLQFVFTTGHLYQRLTGGADRGGGAEQFAKRLDEDYDNGTVALVFTIEHLGAREYSAGPRNDGGPGRVLEATGRSEPSTMFAGESPTLIAAIAEALIRRDVRRSYLLRGSDVPAAKIPVHNSFGGEGTEYQQHLLPAVSLVTGPWTLYNPAFGMEAIDGALMRKQALVFADLVQGLAGTPSQLIAGAYTGYRGARAGLCAAGLGTLGLTRCEGDPYG
jgi:hypothetical protein